MTISITPGQKNVKQARHSPTPYIPALKDGVLRGLLIKSKKYFSSPLAENSHGLYLGMSGTSPWL